ncbi:glycosyltransferase family 39 protein [Actinomadura vinacea]|uniref:Glycosyltransferase family 39 protein n=1 Tax=Actinomadura vinacea TaxID=115336 RepID=A0ABP5VCF3_9ACTN
MATGELERPRPRPAPRKRTRPHGRIVVAAWALLIMGAFVVGDLLKRAGLATEDELPPLHAAPRLLTWQVVPAACLGGAAVAVLPSLARLLPWRVLLPVSWAASTSWTVVLALTDGLDALHRPLDAPTEYPAGLDAVRAGGPAEWLRTFTERLGGYTTHVRGHPPLPTLVLWALEEIGLRGTGWSSALVVASGTSAVVAIAVTVRHIAGETLARRALPFLVLAPLTLWIATAMDAFFLGVGAWATALTAIAAKRNSFVAAAGAGLLLGTLPYFSYGLLPLFALPLAVVILARPNRRVLAILLCCAAVVPLAFATGGFWWPDGVAATRETYLISRGSAQRSYAYFVIANIAVLGLLVGPATASALPAVFSRRRPLAWLVGAALVGVLALDVSGVTKGEVERIWVPYAAWVLLASAQHDPPARRWLAAQVGLTLAIQALVQSHW